MAGQKTPLAALARELIARQRAGSEPVTPEELLAYHAGELSAAERERLQDRLALQPEAARTAADLAHFPDIEPLDDGVRLSDDDVAAQWERLRARLPQPPTAPIRRLRGHALRRAFSWPLPAYALTALLLLISGGLGWRLLTLRRAVETLSQPHINVQVESLPGTFRGAGEPALRNVQLPPAAGYLLLILPLQQFEAATRHRLEIFDADGTQVRTVDDLSPDLHGNLTIELSRSQLPPGEYHLIVREVDQAPAVAAFRLRLSTTTAQP